MNEQERELERKLRELRGQVPPPPHLQSSVARALRSGTHAAPSPRRAWPRVAMAAALAVVATVTVSVWMTRSGTQAPTAEDSVAERLELIRAEVDSIIATLKSDRPEDARRLEAEFDRVLSSLAAVAGRDGAGPDSDTSEQEFATLLDEQLRLVDLAVSLKLGEPGKRE